MEQSLFSIVTRWSTYQTNLQISGFPGQLRDIKEEEIDGGLRRPQHVLSRRYELDGGRLDLRPARRVAVRLAHRVVLELLWHWNKLCHIIM